MEFDYGEVYPKQRKGLIRMFLSTTTSKRIQTMTKEKLDVPCYNTKKIENTNQYFVTVFSICIDSLKTIVIQ